jgi:hypothetical protein
MKILRNLSLRLFVITTLFLGACSSTPKPPVYSNDPYNPEKAEAFTLNFALTVTRAKSKDADFVVKVLDRETGKEIDVREREITVYWKTKSNLQAVLKKGDKNEFSFKAKAPHYCFERAFNIVIGDPRPAQQMTSIDLSSLCRAAL